MGVAAEVLSMGAATGNGGGKATPISAADWPVVAVPVAIVPAAKVPAESVTGSAANTYGWP
eukprot:9104104-Ditylum_brightwellii.AAC.1